MPYRHRANSADPSPGDNASDVALVQAIANGSTDAWHKFVEHYSPLVYSIIRRHLPAEDEDDVRNVYVDLLESLYGGAMLKYDGRARLSTWLAVVARRRALDFLRTRYGRIREPVGYERLSALDREVFRFFFVQRLSIEIVVYMLQWKGHILNANDIVASIEHIGNTVDPRYLKKLDQQHAAQGQRHGRVGALRYLIGLTVDHEEQTRRNRPDHDILEQEARDTAQKVSELVARLPALERKVIYLRFHKQWSAPQIATKLRLDGQRSVYTLIDRVIRNLRRAILG